MRIIYVDVDTLRADHTSPYGYGRPTTPNLQALADKGYFSGPPDGAWGPDSIDALKRLQLAGRSGEHRVAHRHRPSATLP